MNFLILLASAAIPAADMTVIPAHEPVFAASTALDDSSLGRSTARENLAQIATSDQTSRVSNNTINGSSVTGTVSMSGNAFQNLQGLSIINVNSGNNVSINAALNVNIQFSPAP